jgi:hypothetical protein
MSAEKKDNDLAEAARIMRMSSDATERKQAAAKMGKIGGRHSHDNDPIRTNNLNDQIEKKKPFS